MMLLEAYRERPLPPTRWAKAAKLLAESSVGEPRIDYCVTEDRWREDALADGSAVNIRVKLTVPDANAADVAQSLRALGFATGKPTIVRSRDHESGNGA